VQGSEWALGKKGRRAARHTWVDADGLAVDGGRLAERREEEWQQQQQQRGQQQEQE
jgi:hypothetical protein